MTSASCRTTRGVDGSDYPARDDLHQRFIEVRRFTDALSQPLSAEDCAIQSMPEASPTKWHLAHTSWFFENFVLLQLGEAPFHPRYGFLFNSYYEAEGPRQERPKRGLLSRPSLDEVRRYRADVDRRLLRALREMSAERFAALGSVIELGLHHEQQHQELLLTDILHALAGSPLRPAYREGAPPRSPAGAGQPGPMGWIAYDKGVREVGHDGAGFAFDNEAPRHAVYQSAYLLADRLVTCGEYLGFIEDGGYTRPDLWLSDGWEAVKAERWSMPLYWVRQGSSYEAATLDGVRPVDPSEPVCHLSYYEADAFARWAGARLPTEAEWEIAAAPAPLRGTFADGLALHPSPAPPRDPELRTRASSSATCGNGRRAPIPLTRASARSPAPSASTMVSSCAISSCSAAAPARRRPRTCASRTAISSRPEQGGSSAECAWPGIAEIAIRRTAA